MPIVLVYGLSIAAGGLGVKFLGDGLESATDATVKLGGALLLGASAYALIKVAR